MSRFNRLRVLLTQIDGFPVDTGFLVYNDITYPNLLNLFEVSWRLSSAAMDTRHTDDVFSQHGCEAPSLRDQTASCLNGSTPTNAAVHCTAVP